MILPATARYLGELAGRRRRAGINTICERVSGLADSLVDAIAALEHAQHEAHEAGSVQAEAKAFATVVIPAQEALRGSSTSSRRSSPTTCGRCRSTASCSSSTERLSTSRPANGRLVGRVGRYTPDMDTPTLVGTGFVVLGGVIWLLCAYYCYQVAPRFGRRAGVWGILGILFGPIALMILYVLPKGHHVSDKGSGRSRARPATKHDRQAELYEVPKKHK